MKAHLVSTSEPLNGANSVLTLCMIEISPVRQVFMWDEQEMGAELLLSAVNTCRRCIDASRREQLAQVPRRYVYGVMKGEIEG